MCATRETDALPEFRAGSNAAVFGGPRDFATVRDATGAAHGFVLAWAALGHQDRVRLAKEAL